MFYYGVRAYQPLPEFEEQLYVSVRITPTTPEGWKAWEEQDRAWQKEHQEKLDAEDKATRPFYRALILVATPLAVAAIVIGSYLKFRSIGAGLILGGILSVTNAYIDYWDHLNDLTRYTSLFLGFCLLSFVAYRRFVVPRNSPT